MLIPINWLKEYVDIDVDNKTLADKLVSCGFEIDEIIDQKANIQNVVSGKILSLEKHPNADKLQICQIDIKNKTVQIVTGANNIKEGDIVPVALNNALLPNGKKIFDGNLRGVDSFGMLCSGGELELTESDYTGASVNGILILNKDTKVGVDINEVLGLDDVIFDVSITANRADCNSILGIAREVASILKKPLKELDLSFTTVDKHSEDMLSVTIEDEVRCPRYMAGYVEDIKITESPAIIKKRLKAVGIRSINNIVDITNYILTEIGQPMHAFDYSKIEGKKIVVRLARENEEILCLDDKIYKLDKDALVIANANSPMAIGGIMGGKSSSIDKDTTNIVFESARFARDGIRHSSKKLNLRSDSSARYEKGVDFYIQDVGLKRALHLIDKYNYGRIFITAIDNYPNKVEEKVIVADSKKINKILGIDIKIEIMAEILNNLSLKTTIKDDNLYVNVPLFREDIVGLYDIAEEVIRVYGYDNISATLLKDSQTVKGGKTEYQLNMDKLKYLLIGKGMYECISYSFITPKAYDLLNIEKDDALRNYIKIANPIGEDFSVMRTTLAPSMLKTLSTNFVKGNKEVRLFEIAKVYIKNLEDERKYPIEKTRLVMGAYGDEDFYTFKNIAEDIFDTFGINVAFSKANRTFMHPTRTAKIIDISNDIEIGYIGEIVDVVAEKYDIDKRGYLAEIDIEYVLSNAIRQRPFSAIPKYPEMERDIAILVKKEVTANEILDSIKNNNIDILKSSYIFDVYTGNQVKEGDKSVAIKLNFRDSEKTLKDEDTNQAIKIILDKLEKEVGAKLR